LVIFFNINIYKNDAINNYYQILIALLNVKIIINEKKEVTKFTINTININNITNKYLMKINNIIKGNKMLYSCNKCLKIFNKEIDKCPICRGEVKQTLNEGYINDKKINYRCPHCNHNFSFNFDICPNCGKRSNKCNNCGYNLVMNSIICPSCGKKI